jgi:anti-sigma regulatory factor (Ser/Thr protein kinase)
MAPDVLADVKLVFSELVSNSVRHAGLSDRDVVSLSVRVSDGTLSGSVCDGGVGFDPAEAGPGWGLFLMARVVSRWVVTRERGRCCVRFELEIPEPS